MIMIFASFDIYIIFSWFGLVFLEFVNCPSLLRKNMLMIEYIKLKYDHTSYLSLFHTNAI